MRKISIFFFFFFFSYQKLGVRLIHVCAVYTRLYGTAKISPHLSQLNVAMAHIGIILGKII